MPRTASDTAARSGIEIASASTRELFMKHRMYNKRHANATRCHSLHRDCVVRAQEGNRRTKSSQVSHRRAGEMEWRAGGVLPRGQPEPGQVRQTHTPARAP